MKKGTKLVALLLSLALMVPACTPGANPSKSAEPGTSSEAPVNYKVTISNKEELQAEWFVGDQSRKVNLEVEPKANITQLVNEGKIQITSSDPAKLAVEGQMASPVAAGEATITVKCGESEDSVKVTLQARQTNKEKFNIAHEGTAEDPLTNEEALVVAKHEKYNNEDLYVKGEIASWYHTPGERTDGVVSYFLKPAQAGGEQFEIYKCLKSDKTALNEKEIWKGGIATAHGTFTKYGDQYETTSAVFVKCEGTAPGDRGTVNATVAEVVAKGKTLVDGDSEYDYYNITGYVVKKAGDNYFLADTKTAAENDTDMFEIYSAKAEDLAAKLTKNAKVTVKAVIKNYHEQVETCIPLTAADVTVLEAGEPWVINYQEKTTAQAIEVINGLEDGKTADGYYAVSGVVVAITSEYSTKYGNISFTMGDAATDTSLLTVFRLTTDAETAAKIVAGAEVVVKGQLQKYVKDGAMTPELINAKEIEIKNGGGTGQEKEYESLAKYTFTTQTAGNTRSISAEVAKTVFTKAAGTEILGDFTTANSVYEGANGGTGETAWTLFNILKIGKSKTAGKLVFKTTSDVSKIVVKGGAWTKTASLTINGKTIATAFADNIVAKDVIVDGVLTNAGTLEFEFDAAKEITIECGNTNSNANFGIVFTEMEFFAEK